MKTRANTDNRFLLKYLIIGVGCLIFGALCIKDALIAYPAEIPRAAAWEELKAKYPEADWAPKWRELADENGWNSKRPKKDESVKAIKTRILWQWIMLAITLCVGLPCLVWYFVNKGTWVEQTEDGVTSSWGEGFKCSEVTQFDKKKWEKKGIGVVHYDSPSEGPKTFVLDDLKFEREAMDAIVRFVESNIDHNLIVNGPPEKLPSKSDETESGETSDDEMPETDGGGSSDERSE